MTSRLRPAGELLQRLHTKMIIACALLTLLLCSSISTASELEELSVTEADGEFNLRVVSVLDAPADYVYNVITDYKHANWINPTITEVEILSSDDEVVRVRNLSEHWVGPFCFKIDWVGDIEETQHGHINVKTIPEFSSFESGSATWEIRPQGERTWVLHESRLKPSFYLPPLIGSIIMTKRMERDTLITFNRIECLAMIMTDAGMGHEPDFSQTLSKEGSDCINPDE